VSKRPQLPLLRSFTFESLKKVNRLAKFLLENSGFQAVGNFICTVGRSWQNCEISWGVNPREINDRSTFPIIEAA
jgi:hypothetical protein